MLLERLPDDSGFPDPFDGMLTPARKRKQFRKARDVLNWLKWTLRESLDEAVLTVRDRVEGEKVVEAADIVELGRKTFSTTMATIPYYKVLRIEYRGEVIFERWS